MTKRELINALRKIPGNPQIMIVDFRYNTMVALESGETAGIYDDFDVVHFEKSESDGEEIVALMFENPEMDDTSEFTVGLN